MSTEPNQPNDDNVQGNFKVISPYLKDLSFESPGAPDSILQLNKNPQISLDIDIALNKIENKETPITEELYEVVLTIKSSAKNEGDQSILFHVELQYGGVFLLSNISSEHVRPLLAIEAPHLLFPFARQILCEATRNGGFPPLLLDPVDFAGLYYSNIEKTAGNA